MKDVSIRRPAELAPLEEIYRAYAVCQGPRPPQIYPTKAVASNKTFQLFES